MAVIISGVIGLLVFGSMAAGMVYFLQRLKRSEPKTVAYSSSDADRMTFKWEYLPIAAIVFLLIFGEMWVGHILRSRGY